MVVHPAEDVVVDVAEEMHFGLDTPIVTNVLERRMFVEHAAVPAAHLVVGYERTVLDLLFFEHFRRLIKEVTVYPMGHCPMLFGYHFYRNRILDQSDSGLVI